MLGNKCGKSFKSLFKEYNLHIGKKQREKRKKKTN